MLVRASWVLAGVAACSFSTTIDNAPDDGQTLTITDDTFGDGTVTDGVAAGTVEPDGFVLGGLHARAFQSALVDNGEDFAKVLADAAAATQLGAGYAQVPTNWAGGRPRGLGLTADSTFSVVYDGELLLPSGEVTLEAQVDDRGLVQVALDPATPTVFGPLLANTSSITFTVPAAGWYPIRAAMTEDSGNARFVLTIVQGQVRTTVDAARLRARVTSSPGLLVYAWDGQGFVGERGQTSRPTIKEAFGISAPPYDLTASFDRFSLRFAGQLRIDTAGTYVFGATLGIDTNDGWRLWIDGNLVAHEWLGHPDLAVGSVDLAPGWHDILVDYADEIGNAEIAVSMTGPDAPAGGTIDPARLRPVVAFGNTFTVATTASTTIADATSTFVTMPLPGGPTEVIDAVDVGFRIDNQDMTTLQVTLFDCSAGMVLPVNGTPSYHYFPADKSCAGKPTNPVVDWQLRLSDSAAGNGLFIGLGSIRDYGVAALYHGGPKMPFSPVVSYTSGPKPTPGARRIAAVRAIGDLDGGVAEIAVRSAADAASLAATAFEVVRDGEPVDMAGEVTQYRITISTDGWQYPVLDSVEIDYVVAD